MIKEKHMEDFIRPACYKESTGQIPYFLFAATSIKLQNSFLATSDDSEGSFKWSIRSRVE